MTTKKIQSFWRPLAIFLFVALIGVVVWNYITRNNHQGNTEMGDDNGGGRKKELLCINRNVKDKTTVTLRYRGKYSYPKISSSAPETVVVPEVLENGIKVDDSNIHFTFIDVDKGYTNNDTPAGFPSGGNLMSFAPGPQAGFLMTNCPINSGTNRHECQFRVRIDISNVSPASHVYEVNFKFPYGGLFNPPNPNAPEQNFPDTEKRYFRAPVCALEDPSGWPTSGDLPKQILSELSDEFPSKPIDNTPQAEWPKYEIINNEGVLTLIPYFEEDFQKENQE